MVSSEMPELLGICDRILIMSGGRVAGIEEVDGLTQERIMELSEQEKELHQSFTSLYMLIYSLPVFAVCFLFLRTIFYSSGNLLDVRDSWACVVQSIWGGLMTVHIVGAYFVACLEKLFYKYFIKASLE